MSDILLEIERDPEIWDDMADLTEEEKNMLFSEIKNISKNLQHALDSLEKSLNTEDGILRFVETVGKSISSGEFSENIGTEVIEWPEKP
jgi:hypothetical protein